MGNTAGLVPMPNEMVIPDDPDTYRMAVLNVYLCAQLLRSYNLSAVLKAIEKADTLGPIFDPTLWNKRHLDMEEDRAAVEAAMPLWRLGESVMKKEPG